MNFKIIKDLVHGYIQVSNKEEKIINTLNFQRLKDVNQLTAQHVFPSSTHNRFEHSLGVMYLSRKAFISLRKELILKYQINETIFNSMLDHLIIASLLHDVGHAPFSHLGEKYFRKTEITEQIYKTIETLQLSIDKDIFDIKGSNHELMSCYVILNKYIDIINSTYENINLELICRCIIGLEYSPSQKWLENIIITILNSDTIDTDKLDYIMRDTYMTGVSVPEIDTTRLFNNIIVHPRSKKITFLDKALPVIQNIIDSRDILYMYVCNHHVTVYTDFILEFFLKHLAFNFQKNQYLDRINLNDYFSCDAICNQLVSDSDVNLALKSTFRLMQNEPAEETKLRVSNYTKLMFPQLFSREFLKPLWKTIYEYNNFLTDYIKDKGLQDDLVSKMCDKDDYSFRGYIATKLIEKCELKHGEIFVIPRSNKFYSLNENLTFKVYLKDHDVAINDLLPQKDFKELYNNVAFYIFCPKDKKDMVKDAFIEIINKGLPSKEELSQELIILEWFKNERKDS